MPAGPQIAVATALKFLRVRVCAGCRSAGSFHGHTHVVAWTCDVTARIIDAISALAPLAAFAQRTHAGGVGLAGPAIANLVFLTRTAARPRFALSANAPLTRRTGIPTRLHALARRSAICIAVRSRRTRHTLAGVFLTGALHANMAGRTRVRIATVVANDGTWARVSAAANQCFDDVVERGIECRRILGAIVVVRSCRRCRNSTSVGHVVHHLELIRCEPTKTDDERLDFQKSAPSTLNRTHRVERSDGGIDTGWLTTRFSVGDEDDVLLALRIEKRRVVDRIGDRIARRSVSSRFCARQRRQNPIFLPISDRKIETRAGCTQPRRGGRRKIHKTDGKLAVVPRHDIAYRFDCQVPLARVLRRRRRAIRCRGHRSRTVQDNPHIGAPRRPSRGNPQKRKRPQDQIAKRHHASPLRKNHRVLTAAKGVLAMNTRATAALERVSLSTARVQSPGLTLRRFRRFSRPVPLTRQRRQRRQRTQRRQKQSTQTPNWSNSRVRKAPTGMSPRAHDSRFRSMR